MNWLSRANYIENKPRKQCKMFGGRCWLYFRRLWIRIETAKNGHMYRGVVESKRYQARRLRAAGLRALVVKCREHVINWDSGSPNHSREPPPIFGPKALNDRCHHASSALYVYLPCISIRTQIFRYYRLFVNRIPNGKLLSVGIRTWCAAIPYDAVVKYIDLVRCLNPTIALQEASYHSDPPESLTVSIHEFLKVCLAISASWLYIQSGNFPLQSALAAKIPL